MSPYQRAALASADNALADTGSRIRGQAVKDMKEAADASGVDAWDVYNATAFRTWNAVQGFRDEVYDHVKVAAASRPGGT